MDIPSELIRKRTVNLGMCKTFVRHLFSEYDNGACVSFRRPVSPQSLLAVTSLNSICKLDLYQILVFQFKFK